MVLDFEHIETNLPDGRTLLRMEKETAGHEGNHRDNWFIVEKFAAAGWSMTVAVWRSDPGMLMAAYGDGTHRTMMDVHKARSMFDHSSFTRLRLLANRGTWEGVDPLLQAA